jgi:hypothetical protein
LIKPISYARFASTLSSPVSNNSFANFDPILHGKISDTVVGPNLTSGKLFLCDLTAHMQHISWPGPRKASTRRSMWRAFFCALNPGIYEPVFAVLETLLHFTPFPGGRVQFEYRGFNIECSATVEAVGFFASVTVSRTPTGGAEGQTFSSGVLKSFPTQLQAIHYARVWCEMWCDAQLNPAPSKSVLAKHRAPRH